MLMIRNLSADSYNITTWLQGFDNFLYVHLMDVYILF